MRHVTYFEFLPLFSYLHILPFQLYESDNVWKSLQLAQHIRQSSPVIKSVCGHQCDQAKCNLILTNAGHGDSSHTELGEIFFVFSCG